MSRDPFYEQILAGLNGHLDPALFEECITDLLRLDFPTLVPVRGGKDSGMDGAIADGEGEPYPLVVTTAKDVERNLKRSLDSWLKRKRPRRKVALATSRALTPERQHKLKDIAREKGFTLDWFIEQSGVADRLLGSGYWCERLLGLTGEPSTLSVVPISRRPLLEIEPIGRDADLAWLETTSGDRVLSGAPGSGKTFLLYHLSRQGWGVFVTSPDGPVAKDLRKQRPEIVIFDDAHVRPEFLDRLRHLRQETKLTFSIFATTWEGGKDQVIEALGVGETHVHKLELLTRNEIVEVYRRLGVDEDPDTMRYLVDQAANKPGLAATIATLWLQGSWREIIEGKALSRTLSTFFERFVGRESTDVLAAFSLGGDRGMEFEVVRKYFGFPRPQLRQMTAGLAAGGVLSEAGEGFLAVWPRPLRTALIRTVFFPESGARYDYRDLIGLVPHLGKSVEALLEAKALGAAVPSQELRDLVLRSQSENAWKMLALLSEEDAHWVLENHPGDLLDIASGLLFLIPRAVIPRIIERASEPTKKSGGWSLPEQPMSILSSWVEDIRAGSEELIRRRWMVARAAKKFLLEGGENGIGVHGICIALSPKLLGDSLDPGRGNILTQSRGLLPPETLRQIEPIWDEAKEAIQVIDAASCHHFSRILRDWHHQHSAGSVEDAAEKRVLMREFAARILRDLAARSQGSPGLRSAFEDLAMEFGISLGLEQDATFLLLYPKLSPEARGEREAAQIKTLATEWARDEPKDVVQRIVFYEEEARKKSTGSLSNMSDLCRELADQIREPEPWLDECLSQDLRGDLIDPFLERIVRDWREGWESILNRSLDIESLKRRAAILVLRLPDPPPSLLSKVFEEFPNLAALVEERCLNRDVPLPTLRHLLNHSQWETALAAAVGEWCADPQGKVREEILPEWRSAILRSRTEEYSGTEYAQGLQFWLGVILSRDAGLALEWLKTRLRDPDLPWHFLGDSPFAHSLRALRKEQRLSLLQELEPVPIVGDMLPLLIREDVEVYGQVLALSRLSDYHLAPLGGLPQNPWQNLALVALQSGYEPAQIAEAAFYTSHSWAGSGIEYWEKWYLAFTEIEQEGPPELQEVSRHGREIAQKELQRARALEKHIDIYGLVGGLIPHRSGD
jgi:hypothetical protein